MDDEGKALAWVNEPDQMRLCPHSIRPDAELKSTDHAPSLLPEMW